MGDIHDANARDLMRDMPDAGPSEWDIAEALRAADRRARMHEREECMKIVMRQTTRTSDETALKDRIIADIRARG